MTPKSNWIMIAVVGVVVLSVIGLGSMFQIEMRDNVADAQTEFTSVLDMDCAQLENMFRAEERAIPNSWGGGYEHSSSKKVEIAQVIGIAMILKNCGGSE